MSNLIKPNEILSKELTTPIIQTKIKEEIPHYDRKKINIIQHHMNMNWRLLCLFVFLGLQHFQHN